MRVISVIIPAYNAARHIEKALGSIFAGFKSDSQWALEVIVVDDGSDDHVDLANACARFPRIDLIRLDRNRGMCAARNSGFARSRGDIVTLLDADDEFVANWFESLCEIIAEWPPQAAVCYTPCVNDAGELTCATPGYRGWLTAEDMVVERYSGEYNPLFRGTIFASLAIRIWARVSLVGCSHTYGWRAKRPSGLPTKSSVGITMGMSIR